MFGFFGKLSVWRIVVLSLALTILIEGGVAILRFVFGLEATRDTERMSLLFDGLRIHHGYIGVLMLVLAGIFREFRGFRNLMLLIGGALILSDLFHHFVILWPITGSPHFDVYY